MKLLFICTHNRCRSILAEAITNHLADGRIHAASAGSSPQQQVHPKSLQYLAEHKISTQGLRSQSWNEFEGFSPDAIVTLCDSAAEQSCPVWFDGSAQVHWGLQDPSSGQADETEERNSFNRTIDIITRRIKRLLEEDLSDLSGPSLQNELSTIAQQIP